MTKPAKASAASTSRKSAKPAHKPDKPKKAAKPTRTRAAVVKANGPGGSYLYTQAIGDEICRRLAQGESIKSICRSEGMPSTSTVIAWALDDTHGFAARYARAREIGFTLIADEIIEICDDSSKDLIEHPNGTFSVDHEHINRARLRVDTRKWILSKMLPKVYGDKFQVGGDGGEPLTFKLIPGDEKL